MPRAKSRSAWLVSGHKRLIREENIIASGVSSLKVGIQEVGLHGDFKKHSSEKGKIALHILIIFLWENFLYFRNLHFSIYLHNENIFT